MNITLWILQVLLALAFLAHGIMLLAPPPNIAVLMNAFLPRWFQLFLGVAEVLAAVGLTLPGLTRILPGLVPAAAAGVMIVMVCATALHLSRGELSSAATTFVLLLIATFVAHGRWRRLPIAPRRGGASVA
jgi:putative oxidoreductase